MQHLLKFCVFSFYFNFIALLKHPFNIKFKQYCPKYEIATSRAAGLAQTAEERRCGGCAVSAYSAHKRTKILRRNPAERDEEALPFLEIM
jgi:hypothetical protein